MSTKPYVVVFFPTERGVKRGFCLDRNYNFLSDDIKVWGQVTLRDIVEVDQQAWFPGAPVWAKDLQRKGRTHVIAWTNFYG